MHAIRPLTRAASFSAPLSASNTVLGKRRALADDERDVEQPDFKRAKGCAVLCEEWDATANKENIPPFARGPSAPRRPTTLSRRASTGPGPAPNRLRRTVSLASPSTPTKPKVSDDWTSSLDAALSLSSSP
ncbi:hypothetical protein AURDEDRAFT_152716 [Auricularia subglabra TFB-10046 SS5]|nr:hypothetical protein AURDEDRAFT_152716 [Auricularia subglabra TFB-10046 SS5]